MKEAMKRLYSAGKLTPALVRSAVNLGWISEDEARQMEEGASWNK